MLIELIEFYKDGQLFDRCPARWYNNPQNLRARMSIQEIDYYKIVIGTWEEPELD